MAQDFFKGLRQAHPNSHLTLALPEEFFELARDLGYDTVIALSRAQRRGLSGALFWGSHIRRQNFDQAVTLTASASAALFLRLAGISERVGYAEPLARPFLSRALVWEGRASGRHKSDLYRELLSFVTGQPAPELSPAKARSGGETIVLAPGASIRLREWPGFVELAVRLRTMFPKHKIRVVGTAAQARWQEAFERLGDSDVECFIAMTTLTELMELLREARFVVANDSGVAHLAATLAGVPTVVLFGPGDPAYVQPRGPQVRAVRATAVPCSPCESPRCHARYGYQKCLKDLTVDDVLEQIKSLV